MDATQLKALLDKHGIAAKYDEATETPRSVHGEAPGGPLRPGGHVSATRPPSAAMGALTPAELKAAAAWERERGSGSGKAKRKKLKNHLQERPGYYLELERMMDADMAPEFRRALTPGDLKKAAQGGWEAGPRGGKRRRLASGEWEYGDDAGAAEGKPPQKDSKKEANAGKPPQRPGEPTKGEAAPEPPEPGFGDPGAPADGADTSAGKNLQEALQHLDTVEIDDLKARGQAVAKELARKDPKMAQQFAKQMVELEHALMRRRGGDKGAKGKPSKSDMVAGSAIKALLRAFNQAAAPASILGPELGGILAEDRSNTQKKPKAIEKSQLTVPVTALMKAGPFIGPRGGKWADAKHTIPWKDEKPKAHAFEVPEAIFGRAQTIKLEKKSDAGDGKVKIETSIGSPTMPKESVRHFINDLSGVVREPKSGDATVDRVIAGDAKLLGKGDDGIAFQVGPSTVVKVSTTVPFQPANPGHRTPAQAKEMLRKQVELGNKLADAGVPALRSRFVESGEKGFQVKPYVEIPKKFSEAQLKEIKAGVEKMHALGYAMRDTVQAGLTAAGKVVFFDTGKVAKARSTADKEDDMDSVRALYRDAGIEWAPTTPADFARKLDDLGYELTMKDPSPERKAQLVKDFLRTSVLYRAKARKAGVPADEIDDIIDFAWPDYADHVKKSLTKAGPYGAGKWGPVATIAPIGGSAPRGETPPIPDFQEIYYQPEDDKRKKQARKQARIRRNAASGRNVGRYGFHGAVEVTDDPEIRYVRPTEPDHTGPKRAQRRPVYRAEPMPPDKEAEALEDEREEEPKKAKRKKKRQDRLAGDRATKALNFDDYIEALCKAAAKGGKYIKRVPYTDSKGRRRYRYYYAESAVAREAQAGEEVKIGKQRLRVEEVHDDGSLTIEIAGKRRTLSQEQYTQLLARHYGHRFYDYAEKRAKQAINAVYRHVPKSMLAELKGETLEARLEDLQKRAPEVYQKLEKSFQRAGVRPRTAKRIVARTLERRGWTEDARAAAIGSVLTKQTKATTFYEVLRGAENLAGGGIVEAKHVGAVVELRKDEPKPFHEQVADIAKQAEAELAKLSALLSKAQKGDANAGGQAVAEALTATAIAKLNLLTQAFPGLKDKAAEQARDTLLQVPAAVPAPPKTKGAETTVFVAGDNGQPRALKARYVLMEAGDVKASHDPIKGFRKRDDYPEGVQERAYHSDTSEQQKVRRNAQRLRGEFVVNTNPDAVNGPPLVTTDGHALGGNSRTMSMQLAYEEHPEQAAAMRAYLEAHAHEVGFSKDDVAAMKRPMLVRVVDDPASDGPSMFGGDTRKHSKEEMRLLVRQMNESFTQGMDPRTMQVAMGRKLDDAALTSLSEGMQEGETLAQFLTSTRAKGFTNHLSRLGVIDDRNRNQYMKDGKLNADGRTLVSRILVGRLVGDADILSDTRPSTVEAIARATPYIISAKQYGAGYDIANDLAQALQDFNDVQRRVASGSLANPVGPKTTDREFEQLFAQQQLMAETGTELHGEKNPRAKKLLRILIAKPGSQQLSKVFRDFAQQASQHPEGQGGLFGGALSPDEVLDKVQKEAISKG